MNSLWYTEVTRMKHFRSHLSLAALLLVAIALQPVFGWAASDAETIIAECQKRTGMGRESCIAFIKKYMSVERCEQYTSLSALECAKKLEELRRTPEFQSNQPDPGSASPVPRPTPQPAPTPSPSPSGSLRERVLEVKRDKEHRLLLIEEETAKIIQLLEDKGYATDALNERLRLFREKRAAALSAYDQYASFAADPTRPPLAEPRRLVGQVLNESASYYRTSLLPALREAIRQVAANDTL